MRHAADRLSVSMVSSDTTWVSHSLTIRVSPRSVNGMVWRCFDVSLRPSSNNVSRPSSCGERNSTSIQRKSMPMPTWIRWPLVLRSRRERQSRPIWLPFFLRKTYSLSTKATAAETQPLPRPLPGMPPLCLSHFQPSPRNEEEELADNAARHDWIAEDGRQQREVHGLYQRTADFGQHHRS